MKDFLVIYDHRKAERVELREIADSAEAVRIYGDVERQYESDPLIEVVLLGADSVESVMVTHPNYFVSGHQSIPSAFRTMHELAHQLSVSEGSKAR